MDGRVSYDGNNVTYQYVLNDYQGNTRVLFQNNGGNIAEEVESYSYYPNGALHSQETDLVSKYTFSGKELQTELDLGWSDFGTRCLDTWSGKWLGVDILAEAKPFMSPYSYGLGNPVRFSDPSGMIEKDQDGLMSVSTSLWGRDVTGGENTGEVLSSDFLSAGQRSRDTDTYTFNEHAGDEVGRNITENGVDITYSGAFLYQGKNKSMWDWSGLGTGFALSGTLLADDASIVGIIDDVAIPFILVGATAYTLYDNRELIREWADDIGKTTSRSYPGGSGYQYTLRATANGYYPTMGWGSKVPVGTTYLNKGDIWKIGESSKRDRYRASYLNSIGPGVRMQPEFYGTIPQIKLVEKMKIWGYVMRNFQLPPGNKIFR